MNEGCNVLLLFPCASYDTLEVTFKAVNDIQVVDYNSIQKKKKICRLQLES